MVRPERFSFGPFLSEYACVMQDGAKAGNQTAPRNLKEARVG